MGRLQSLTLGVSIIYSVFALPTNEPRRLATEVFDKRQNVARADRAQAVVDTFKLSWEGYYKYAFPNDELKPVTNGFSNSRYDYSCSSSAYIPRN
jgi:mannosyl-oligosaccharide alpha-1,2-mannosidase